MTIIVLKPQRVRRAPKQMPTGPVGGLTDPRFRYVPHLETDVAKTFRRVRAEMARGERL
ncbi:MULTISPECIES: hypothetical protein [unclassified Variovorax]|uniref:hypothetical protein n=1 Tax=unclassified Variovorax TaxID=663243 RepID=UPI002575811A|nr:MULTISPECIES: hypothetical protein [unclassified Variovorax]MDM0090285.1 hypothetical protein [Variovorax sp. J22G40]MDM0148049.1 hypothetical protein [Variovorax sp. J2P1-31]